MAQGAEPAPTTPAEFASFIARERDEVRAHRQGERRESGLNDNSNVYRRSYA